MQFNILSVIEYIEEKIENNEQVTVRSCCEYFNYSYCHFSRLFKREVGISMSKYISAMKREKSIEILLNPKNTVTDAYTSVQYQSPSSFSRNFKKDMGLSPKDYKKRVNDLAVLVQKIILTNEVFQLDYYSDEIKENEYDKSNIFLNVEINIPEKKNVPVLYVGLYRNPIVLRNPLVEKVLFRQNKCSFKLRYEGSYNILVTGIEENMERENMFIPKKSIKVCTKLEVLKSKNNNIIINLQEPKKGDPPVIINFPKLAEYVLDCSKTREK